MEYNVIFYGKLSPFLEEVAQKVEGNEDALCFRIESLSEYAQSIGIMAGEEQKALTIFGQMKSMAHCFEAGKKLFQSGSALGILCAQDKPMHPLLASGSSNIEFFQESLGADALLEKIDVFFAMGALSLEAPKEEDAGIFKKKISSSKTVIDTSSRQFVERMGFLEADPPERKLMRENALFMIKQGRPLKSVDMFSRKLVDIKNVSIDRRVDVYLKKSGVHPYTESWLKKDPEPIDFLEAKEEVYYPPSLGIFRYFPMLSEMIGKDSLQRPVIQRLAALTLEKEFQCETRFYKIAKDKIVPEGGEEALGEEMDHPSSLNLQGPNWLDESFESEDNVFTLPYYFDGKCRGFAQVFFRNGPLKRERAAEVEAVLSVCKGAYKV